MGWGAKKVVTPQQIEEFTDRLAESVAIAPTVEWVEPVASTATAETAWHKYRASKGWTPETTTMIVYEFIKSRGLFADLESWAKKGRR